MKNVTRAIRRHHRARLIEKRVAQRSWMFNSAPAAIAKIKGRLADTPTPCSCWACGNPRRIFGALTLSEKRSFFVLKEGVCLAAGDKDP
jgi:hypothetical protein